MHSSNYKKALKTIHWNRQTVTARNHDTALSQLPPAAVLLYKLLFVLKQHVSMHTTKIP